MTFMAKLATLTLGAALATTVATAALGQGMRTGAMGGPMRGAMGGPMSKATFQKIDTNGDKLLSPEEIRAYEASLVKGLDANGDGFLTADEIAAKMTGMSKERLTAWATRMAARFGKDGKVSVDRIAKMPRPMDRIMNRMLKVGGGKVSQATFEAVEVMGGMGPQGQAGPRQDRRGPMAGHDGHGWRGDHGSRGWMNGDGPRGRMHGDGPRSRIEGHGPRGPMGGHGGRGDWHGAGRGPMMGWAMPKFADIDANHDGFVTGDEYAAYKLAQVKAIDANGDGFITPAEFADFAAAKMQPRITQRADNLVKRLDLNSDGKLSIEELAAAPIAMRFAHLPTDKNGNVTERAFLRMRGPGGDHQRGWHRGGRQDGGRGPGWGGWGGMMPPPAADAPSGN
jgi:Ca2+-binding EF-hand superfamily protein